MSSSPPAAPELAPPLPAVGAPAPEPRRNDRAARLTLAALVLLAGAALLSSVMLWQRLSAIQEQLARQSADSGANAIEARTLARQAQEIARDAAARQAVLESRLGDVALQRSQMEELVQALSRSRDENLVVDLEAALHLAQQQSQLTGSAEPLLAALRSADERLARAAQPRLARLRSAIERDVNRLKTSPGTDVPGLLARLDEVVQMVDDLPLANAAPGRRSGEPGPAPAAHSGAVTDAPWWARWREVVLEEVRGLVRVSRIDQPEAVLLAPEQGFFLRENLKLKLLNARLSLLARQHGAARADVQAAVSALHKYFDPASRRVQAAATQLQQIQLQLRSAEPPRIEETFAALAAAAAGR